MKYVVQDYKPVSRFEITGSAADKHLNTEQVRQNVYDDAQLVYLYDCLEYVPDFPQFLADLQKAFPQECVFVTNSVNMRDLARDYGSSNIGHDEFLGLVKSMQTYHRLATHKQYCDQIEASGFTLQSVDFDSGNLNITFKLSK